MLGQELSPDLITLGLCRPMLPGTFPALRGVNPSKAQTPRGPLASGYRNNSAILTVFN